ncbi:MAG: peptidoglycan-binding domain-containing protein [Polyangiales bacterium]
MLSLSFVHRRAIYTIANRRDVHSIPRGYVTVSPFEAHIALADRFRRDLDVVQHFLRSVPGGPHDVRSDLQVREFFKTAFDEPQGELVCFKREIVLPPPPTAQEAETTEAAPSEWIELAFVDPDGNPVPVRLELQLPSGRVMGAVTHMLHTTDQAGSAKLRYAPSGSGARQLSTFPGHHEIRQGQDVQAIAWAYGRTDWQTIWNDSNNDKLREACPEPNVLMPGMRLYIPKDESEPQTLAMNQRHEFVIEVPVVRLHVRFTLEGEPRANEAYVLYLEGEEPREGTTDGDGVLDEPIPIHAASAVVSFATPDAEEHSSSDDNHESSEDSTEYRDIYKLRLGHLNPTTDVTGAQDRLGNLGYSVGRHDGQIGPRTRDALTAFQHQQGLETSGQLDDATRQKLADIYPG